MEMRALLRGQEAVGLIEKVGRARTQCWQGRSATTWVPFSSPRTLMLWREPQLREPTAKIKTHTRSYGYPEKKYLSSMFSSLFQHKVCLKNKFTERPFVYFPGLLGWRKQKSWQNKNKGLGVGGGLQLEVCDQVEGPSPECDHDGDLIFDFQPPKLWKINCYCL